MNASGDIYVGDALNGVADVFAPEATGPTQTLTVKVEGAGTVTCEIEGSGKPEACASEYPEGDKLVLTAKADPGSKFAGWKEACSGTGECKVTMSAPVKVTAEFTANTKVALTIKETGTGAGKGKVQCNVNKAGFGTCAPEYSEGTELILKGAAESGATFEGWSDGKGSASSCSGTGECPFTITEPSEVTAMIGTSTKQPLSVKVEGAGTVTCEIEGSGKPEGCASEYPEGDKLVLTAKADPASNSPAGKKRARAPGNVRSR